MLHLLFYLILLYVVYVFLTAFVLFYLPIQKHAKNIVSIKLLRSQETIRAQIK